MIQKLFSDLSDNGKKLMTVALIFVAAALFDRLLIGPTMSRLSAIDQEIAKEEGIVKQDMRFLGHKDKILKESKALEPYITAKIPSEDEIIARFLKKVEMLANKANVTLVKVTPSTGEAKDNYIRYTADLECSGVLSDMVTFMHLVNSSPDLMKVVKFNMGSKKIDSDDIKATMTVSKIIVGNGPMPVKLKAADATAPDAKAQGSQQAAAAAQ